MLTNSIGERLFVISLGAIHKPRGQVMGRGGGGGGGGGMTKFHDPCQNV